LGELNSSGPNVGVKYLKHVDKLPGSIKYEELLENLSKY
jgi:hypothetical protein